MTCPYPIKIKDPSRSEGFFYVGCYKCGACRANRRADWSFRLAEEAWISNSCWFVTLTYADHKLKYVDEETGECFDNPILVKRDFQLYMKRLRKQLSNKVRYYAVGEYGTKSKRPHYHMIIYNIDRQDLNAIHNSWQLGHTRFAPVTPARIHYITKYHVNYRKDMIGRTPEFALMSRRPGIGFEYAQRMAVWHYENDANYVINQGFKQRMPQYLKNKVFDKRTKKRLSEQGAIQSLNGYYKELELLSAKGYKEPLAELQIRERTAASLVTNKGGRTDQI